MVFEELLGNEEKDLTLWSVAPSIVLYVVFSNSTKKQNDGTVLLRRPQRSTTTSVFVGWIPFIT